MGKVVRHWWRLIVAVPVGAFIGWTLARNGIPAWLIIGALLVSALIALGVLEWRMRRLVRQIKAELESQR
jgi:uncharacterized membrane protein AbrB (regulator of aidB expression)